MSFLRLEKIEQRKELKRHQVPPARVVHQVRRDDVLDDAPVDLRPPQHQHTCPLRSVRQPRQLLVALEGITCTGGRGQRCQRAIDLERLRERSCSLSANTVVIQDPLENGPNMTSLRAGCSFRAGSACRNMSPP